MPAAAYAQSTGTVDFEEEAIVVTGTRTRDVGGIESPDAAKAKAVRELLDLSGFTYHYLPSYSPDLNPIEPVWAKVKGRLREVAARTANALHEALGSALDAITPQNAQGFFRHAGYARPNQPAIRFSLAAVPAV